MKKWQVKTLKGDTYDAEFDVVTFRYTEIIEVYKDGRKGYIPKHMVAEIWEVEDEEN